MNFGIGIIIIALGVIIVIMGLRGSQKQVFPQLFGSNTSGA